MKKKIIELDKILSRSNINYLFDKDRIEIGTEFIKIECVLEKRYSSWRLKLTTNDSETVSFSTAKKAFSVIINKLIQSKNIKISSERLKEAENLIGLNFSEIEDMRTLILSANSRIEKLCSHFCLN